MTKLTTIPCGCWLYHHMMHVGSRNLTDQVFVYLAGALLAVGITNCGVQDECDPAYALLCESVNHADDSIRIGAIMGLGLAYAGTQKAEVQVSWVTCSPRNHAGMHTCMYTPVPRHLHAVHAV